MSSGTRGGTVGKSGVVDRRGDSLVDAWRRADVGVARARRDRRSPVVTLYLDGQCRRRREGWAILRCSTSPGVL